eukprot:354010-Chlamydomonas_euryale.AAC.1
MAEVGQPLTAADMRRPLVGLQVWGRRWRPKGWWSPEQDPGRGLPLSLVLLTPTRVPSDIVTMVARLGPVSAAQRSRACRVTL